MSPVTEKTGFKPEITEKAQTERTRQQDMMRQLTGQAGSTVVWTATTPEKNLACISSWDMHDPWNTILYIPRTRGLLGRLEQDIDDIVFVSPFFMGTITLRICIL